MSATNDRCFWRQRYGARIAHLAEVTPSGPIVGSGPGTGSARCGAPLDTSAHERVGRHIDGPVCPTCLKLHFVDLDRDASLRAPPLPPIGNAPSMAARALAERIAKHVRMVASNSPANAAVIDRMGIAIDRHVAGCVEAARIDARREIDVAGIAPAPAAPDSGVSVDHARTLIEAGVREALRDVGVPRADVGSLVDAVIARLVPPGDATEGPG